MVRRRMRTAKAVAGSEVVVAVPNANLFDEQYFASPKRKDCKLENTAAASILLPISEEQMKALRNGGQASSGRSKSERNAGKNGAASFATRSQAKTIENFFKTKQTPNAGKHTELEGEQMSKSNRLLVAQISSDSPPPLPHFEEATIEINGEIFLQPEFLFELSEDTNDTDNTELSEDTAAAVAELVNFTAHRTTLRDSRSSVGSATDNIFLQEPVLTLNVDKTPNQASSIKINKSIEIEPIFSSPPSITTAVLNGRFNKIVSLDNSPSKREYFGLESKIHNACVLLPDNDNSSCDSGVAFSSSLDNSNSNPLTPQEPQTRRRKPATPHRIVCPSPIKSASRALSPGRAALLSPGRKAKEHLSPRKSPRQLTSAASKTRRRLNQQKDLSCYQSATANEEKNQNGCLLKSHIDATNLEPYGSIIDDNEQEIICIDDIDIESDKIQRDIDKETNAPKLNLNPTKPHTAQQHSSNNSNQNLLVKGGNQRSKTSVAKAQQPKNKHKTTQPLTTTNGNRELTEFFPVRRSVRKTKTAVKEEMMRSLEQAILEERADGLRIENFEHKGRGIVADRRFERGEFVVEYIGELISMPEATDREQRYALDENAGCYMYYFKHKNQQYCIDATVDTGKLGRLVNHSRNGNLITKVVVVKQRPHLILIAKDDIEAGEELTYDYGDRSKEALIHHPWLAF